MGTQRGKATHITYCFASRHIDNYGHVEPNGESGNVNVVWVKGDIRKYKEKRQESVEQI